MTIGQITISAADWLASRVNDRMALVVAGQKSQLAQQVGSMVVEPGEENTGAQLDQRARERSILAAQESYKRVAQRIKSRLANPPPPAENPDGSPRTETGRISAIENLRSSPKLAATVIAAEHRAETANPANSANPAQARPDAIFGLVETEPKKAEDRQAASVAEKEKEVATEAHIRAMHEREDSLTAHETNPIFEKGLWDDLFVADDLTDR